MKTLLYATDCTQSTSTALKYAHRFSVAMNARLHVLHVYDLAPFETVTVRSRSVLESNFFSEQHAILKDYCKEQLKHELGPKKITSIVKKNRSVPEAIFETAKKLNPDLVMVGTKNPKTLRGFFKGNIANELMKKTEWPLLIVPNGVYYHGLSTLLYATDFEETDVHAIKSAVEIAEPYGALIKVVHVLEKKEHGVDRQMIWLKKAIKQKIGYPEIVFKIQEAKDVESGLLNCIDTEMPEILAMMERENDSLLDRFLHKDLVKTMEKEITIPLLVFNKKSIKAKFAEQTDDTFSFELA
ncbi:hypothetical protein DKG77_15155 [Flagellimonas aquimarina]|uniref:UspA domain-containing protein n=1 Tax=Flagellimonas aquimarina TaxID=2201895 RepID=A0A316KXU5_9FLAO|nr:universal stress protein [Allomuricauda koreensis]PWL37635.1 hypothetical protein DKG77_15155 [Allomuricauda koreensis]